MSLARYKYGTEDLIRLGGLYPTHHTYLMPSQTPPNTKMSTLSGDIVASQAALGDRTFHPLFLEALARTLQREGRFNQPLPRRNGQKRGTWDQRRKRILRQNRWVEVNHKSCCYSEHCPLGQLARIMYRRRHHWLAPPSHTMSS